MTDRENCPQVLKQIQNCTKDDIETKRQEMIRYCESFPDVRTQNFDLFISKIAPELRYLYFENNAKDLKKLNTIYSFSAFGSIEETDPVFLGPVTCIKPYAFCCCKNLTSVTLYARERLQIGFDAFYGCDNLKQLIIYHAPNTTLSFDDSLQNNIRIVANITKENLNQSDSAKLERLKTLDYIDLQHSDINHLIENVRKINLLADFCPSAREYAAKWLSAADTTWTFEPKIAFTDIQSASRDTTSDSSTIESIKTHLNTIIYKGLNQSEDALCADIGRITKDICYFANSEYAGNANLSSAMRELVCPDENGLLLEERVLKSVENAQNETLKNNAKRTHDLLIDFKKEAYRMNQHFAKGILSYDFANYLCILNMNNIVRLFDTLILSSKHLKDYLQSLMINVFVMAYMCRECHEKTDYADKKQLLVAKSIGFCAQMDWLKECCEKDDLYRALSQYSILGDLTSWPEKAHLFLSKYLKKNVNRKTVIKKLIEMNIKSPSKAYEALCKLCYSEVKKTMEERANEIFCEKDKECFKRSFEEINQKQLAFYYEDKKRAERAFNELVIIHSGSLLNSDFTDVVLGNNVQKIQTGAFQDCAKLEKLTIVNDDYCIIETDAFLNCENLQSIHFTGKGQYLIAPAAFENCSDELRIEFDDFAANVASSTHSCFAKKGQRMQIIDLKENRELEYKETLIFNFYFKYSKLHGRNIFNSNYKQSDKDYALNALHYCNEEFDSATFLSNCSKIESFAFYKCSKLQRVRLCATETIDDAAFFECKNLSSVEYGDTDALEKNVSGKAFLLSGPIEFKYVALQNKKKAICRYKEEQFKYYQTNPANPVCSAYFEIAKEIYDYNCDPIWLMNRTLTDFYNEIEKNGTIQYFFPFLPLKKCTVSFITQTRTGTKKATGQLCCEANELFEHLYDKYCSIFRRCSDETEKSAVEMLKSAKMHQTGDVNDLNIYKNLLSKLYENKNGESLYTKLQQKDDRHLLYVLEEILQKYSSVIHIKEQNVYTKYSEEDHKIILNTKKIYNDYEKAGMKTVYEKHLSELFKGYLRYELLYNGTQKKEYINFLEGVIDCVVYFFIKDDLKNKELAAQTKKELNSGVYPSWPGGLYRILSYQCYDDEDQMCMMLRDLTEMSLENLDEAYEIVEKYHSPVI